MEKITHIEPTDIAIPTPPKKFFGKRITFVDPMNKSMKYNRFETYAENKQDYYDTLRLVYTGKCKDIFEAYAISH